jgi:hypothetical protein
MAAIWRKLLLQTAPADPSAPDAEIAGKGWCGSRSAGSNDSWGWSSLVREKRPFLVAISHAAGSPSSEPPSTRTVVPCQLLRCEDRLLKLTAFAQFLDHHRSVASPVFWDLVSKWCECTFDIDGLSIKLSTSSASVVSEKDWSWALVVD